MASPEIPTGENCDRWAPVARMRPMITPNPADRSTYWQKCSICKKPIPFGGAYLKCAISTCNRKSFQLWFCSDSCWDAHNPDQNHRHPSYTEHVAPAAPG